MLVLKRRIGDSIYIERPDGELIKLTVLATKDNDATRIHIKKRDTQPLPGYLTAPPTPALVNTSA